MKNNSELNIAAHRNGFIGLYSGIASSGNKVNISGSGLESAPGLIEIGGNNVFENTPMTVADYANATIVGAQFSYKESHIDISQSKLRFLRSNASFTNNISQNGAVVDMTDSFLIISASRVSMENSTASVSGGAINSSATLKGGIDINGTSNVDFIRNSAVGGSGGAISATGRNMEMNISASAVNFTGNTALSSGGALGVFALLKDDVNDPLAPNSVFYISNSKINFTNNISSTGYGGGAAFLGLLTFSINNSQMSFASNNAASGGGAFIDFGVRGGDGNVPTEPNQIVEITNSRLDFTGNIATTQRGGKGYGGGLAIENTSLDPYEPEWEKAVRISGSSLNFSGNSADRGGALYAGVFSGPLIISADNSVFNFTDNKARSGGAIFIGTPFDGSQVSIVSRLNMSFDNSKVTFERNTALESGGALSVTRGSSVSFASSKVLFKNNSAALGGALYLGILNNQDDTPLVSFVDSDVVFEGNTAGYGAAVYIQKSETNLTPGLNAEVSFRGGSVEFINNISTMGSGIVHFNDSGIVNDGDDMGVIIFNDARVLAHANEAQDGGFLYLNSALSAMSNVRPRTIHFEGDVTLTSNRARGAGGALYLVSDNVPNSSLTDVKFGKRITGDSGESSAGTDTNISANTAVSSGGAIVVKGQAKLDFEWTRLTAIGNISEANGGFIYAQDAKLTLNGQANISGNEAVLGAAIYFENNDPYLDYLDKDLKIIAKSDDGKSGNIYFTSNKAKQRGGAVYAKGAGTNSKSILTLEAQSANIVFRGNLADNTANDIYLDNFSTLVLNSDDKSVAMMGGIIAPQANETTVINEDGLNIIGGNVDIKGKVAINSGILAFSADRGISTAYGLGGYIKEITVEPGASLKIDPSAAANIEGSGYSKRYSNTSFPKMARIKAESITMKGNLIMNVNTDESAYGQLVMINGGTIDNIEMSTFTAIVEGKGVAAGTFIRWEYVNNQPGAFNVTNTFGKIEILGGGDFEVLSFVSTSAAQVRTNGYFGRFAVVNYFDFDNTLRRLNYSQGRAGENLYAAHIAGDDRTDGDVKSMLIAATANTAPSMDPTGYKGRQIFDMLSGSFIANVLKQSALNNTEGLYRRMDRDIKKNQARDKFEESISDKAWSYLTFSGAQYEEYKDNVREFKHSAIGLEAGADMIITDTLLAGAYFGFARGSYRQGEDKASMFGLEAGLYGGYFRDIFNFKASLGLGFRNVGISRNISIESVSMEGYSFDGYLANPKSKFNIYTVKYAAEAEYVGEAGNETDIRPFVALQGGTVYNGEIKEKGGNSANITIKAGKYDRLAALYGLRMVENGYGSALRWKASLYGGYVINGAKAQYEADFLGEAMTIYSLGENLAFLGIGGGVEYDINEKVFAFVSLDINRNNGFTGYSAQVGASYRLGRSGPRIKDRLTISLVEETNALLIAVLNNKVQEWMDQEVAKGNTQVTKEDAMKALNIEKGMRVYVVEANNKMFYFDRKEDAEAFVDQIAEQGVQITRRDIRAITVEDQQINAVNNAQERVNVKVYENGAMEIAPLIDSGSALSGAGGSGGSVSGGGRAGGRGGGRAGTFNEPGPQVAAGDTGATTEAAALQKALSMPTASSKAQQERQTGAAGSAAGAQSAISKDQQFYNLSFGKTAASVGNKYASGTSESREKAGTLIIGDSLNNKDASSLGGATVHYPIAYTPIVIEDIFTTPLRILALPGIGESIESGPGRVVRTADISADLRRQEREEIMRAQREERQARLDADQERREREEREELVFQLAFGGTAASIGNKYALNSANSRNKAGSFKVGYMLEDKKAGTLGTWSVHYPIQYMPLMITDIFVEPRHVFSLPGAGEDMEKGMPGKIRKGDESMTLEQEEAAMASMTSQERARVQDAQTRRIFSVEAFRLAVAEFKTGSSELTDASKASIKANAEDLLKKEFGVMTIEGHTDSTGSAAVNRALSAKRAKAVYDEYVKNGIPKEKLNSVGLGPDFPIADNSTNEGRQKNRRVEIFME